MRRGVPSGEGVVVSSLDFPRFCGHFDKGVFYLKEKCLCRENSIVTSIRSGLYS